MFARQAKKKISVKIDETKLRKNDIRTVKASFAKLKSVTDWKPEIPLQKTVSDTLEYWRKKI
jgi:GDP-4-dehydro-6-deoxy-D-mannose reductase